MCYNKNAKVRNGQTEVDLLATLADIIEDYIKRQLQKSHNSIVVINRAQLADSFECAPSQINYVLETRFNKERGYIIESRRGGGGYIRIVKIRSDDIDKTVGKLIGRIGNSISPKGVDNILVVLHDMGFLSTKNVQLIRGVIQQETAGVVQGEDMLRAKLLRAMLCLKLQEIND